MLLLPAIDLKDGQCVRLRQGRMEDTTVFSDSPVDTATRWVNAGAKRLHLVDLNGAFDGLVDEALEFVIDGATSAFVVMKKAALGISVGDPCALHLFERGVP